MRNTTTAIMIALGLVFALMVSAGSALEQSPVPESEPNITELLASEYVQTLVRLQVKEAGQSARLGPDHPRVLRTKAKIRRIEQELEKLKCAETLAQRTPVDVGSLPEAFTNTIGMRFRLIPPGAFTMGAGENDPDRQKRDMPAHRVSITHPFYIGVYEVTQEEWVTIMGENPSANKGAHRPVEMVSWEDARAFVRKLSEREGFDYRLPTETQWEYACRAGTETPYHTGTSWDECYGWCVHNAGANSHVVGMRKPNAWGLHDMCGNVWEWCQDWYAPYPEAPLVVDPAEPTVGRLRVLRGGGWDDDCMKYFRSAYRNHRPPDSRNAYRGFRVVRMP